MPYQLHYWPGIQGRGEFVRLALEAAGTKLQLSGSMDRDIEARDIELALDLRGKVRESAPRWHTSKPDYDNIAKAITDALTKAGIWADDAQVAIGSVVKRYVGDGEQPRAEISIEELPGTPDPTRKETP